MDFHFDRVNEYLSENASASGHAEEHSYISSHPGSKDSMENDHLQHVSTKNPQENSKYLMKLNRNEHSLMYALPDQNRHPIHHLLHLTPEDNQSFFSPNIIYNNQMETSKESIYELDFHSVTDQLQPQLSYTTPSPSYHQRTNSMPNTFTWSQPTEPCTLNERIPSQDQSQNSNWNHLTLLHSFSRQSQSQSHIPPPYPSSELHLESIKSNPSPTESFFQSQSKRQESLPTIPFPSSSQAIIGSHKSDSLKRSKGIRATHPNAVKVKRSQSLNVRSKFIKDSPMFSLKTTSHPSSSNLKILQKILSPKAVETATENIKKLWPIYHSSFSRNITKWTDRDRSFIVEGIRFQNRNNFITQIARQYPESQYGMAYQHASSMLQEMDAKSLETNINDIDWKQISNNHLPTRSASECRRQWTTVFHPLISNAKFSAAELAKLRQLSLPFGACSSSQNIPALSSNRKSCDPVLPRTTNVDIIDNITNDRNTLKLNTNCPLNSNEVDSSQRATASSNLKVSNPKSTIDIPNNSCLHNWINIAAETGPSRTAWQCVGAHVRQKYSSLDKVSRKWSHQQDAALIELYQRHILRPFTQMQLIDEKFPSISASSDTCTSKSKCTLIFKLPTLSSSLSKFVGKGNGNLYYTGVDYNSGTNQSTSKFIYTHNTLCPSQDGWIHVATHLAGRTTAQCNHRWQKSLDFERKTGRWSEIEDAWLISAVKRVRRMGIRILNNGIEADQNNLDNFESSAVAINSAHSNGAHSANAIGQSRIANDLHINWALVQKFVPNRTDMQCRERFMNVLHPAFSRSQWRLEEDSLLCAVVSSEGNQKWSHIASTYFPSRTDNQCRRRYYSLCSRGVEAALSVQQSSKMPTIVADSPSNKYINKANNNIGSSGTFERLDHEFLDSQHLQESVTPHQKYKTATPPTTHKGSQPANNPVRPRPYRQSAKSPL